MSKQSTSKRSGGKKKGNKEIDDFDALINEAIKENRQLTTNQSLNLPTLKTTEPSLNLEPFDTNFKYETNKVKTIFEWYSLTHDHLMKQLKKDIKLALNNNMEGLIGLKKTLTLISEEECVMESFDTLVQQMSSMMLTKIHHLQERINATEKPLCPHSITDKIERLSDALVGKLTNRNELEKILNDAYGNYSIPSTVYSLFATAHLNVGMEH